MATLAPPAPATAAVSSSHRRVGPSRTSRRRLLADRGAAWLVTAGGMAIIASILGILIFILIEVLPLARRASVRLVRDLELTHPALALLGDEYDTHVATLGDDGVARVVRIADGAEVASRVLAPSVHGAMVPPGGVALAAATRDGRVQVLPVGWSISFDASDQRHVEPQLGEPITLTLDPAGEPLSSFAAALAEDGSAAAVAQIASGQLAYAAVSRSTNAITGAVEESTIRQETTTPGRLGPLVLDRELANVYAGTAHGELVWWRIADGTLQPPTVVPASGAGISVLAFLIGDRSLVVGQTDGELSVWFPVRQPDEGFRLTRIRDLPRLSGPVTLLAASQRNRTFLAVGGSDELGLFYSTSGRTLWRGRSPLSGATAVGVSPKADAALVAGPGRLALLAVANAHPEVTWKSLFGKVWYEGYERPERVWQSTGGTDDFESKLSLTPLLVGTLKGTFYSLLLAIPLGVLGAMYASQFMHPRLLRVVKPTVEIMAALPSVVLGFLAGLWLAPRVERAFPALLLLVVVVPAATLGAGWSWRALPTRLRHRLIAGSEVLLHAVAILLAFWLCFALAPSFERLAFGGNFQGWLLATTGLAYDQRNAIVVGLAMGFAVIPIIFAISEDAFTNVPPNLISGSLALGATRWQTVTRVVLPTASPGIFSAVMIGFGRAVGETMIVLMATGNTPITSWSPFNGFRTLSANIAVEIPEAPVDSSLYRTLFLAALLLFAMTFVVNTLAELVRQRLRRKFAQL